MNQKLDLTKKLLPQDFSNKLLSESLKLWWFDHRIVDQGGLRLTKEGFKALKEAGIKSYRVNFENEIIVTNQLIVMFNRHIPCPFFLNNREIFVFSEHIAVQLVLFSGNVERYIRAKLNQVKN